MSRKNESRAVEICWKYEDIRKWSAYCSNIWAKCIQFNCCCLWGVTTKVLVTGRKKFPRVVGISGYRGYRKIPTFYRTNLKSEIWKFNFFIPRLTIYQKFLLKFKISGFFVRYDHFPRVLGMSGYRPVLMVQPMFYLWGLTKTSYIFETEVRLDLETSQVWWLLVNKNWSRPDFAQRSSP